jgi:hypothetical protein
MHIDAGARARQDVGGLRACGLADHVRAASEQPVHDVREGTATPGRHRRGAARARGAGRPPAAGPPATTLEIYSVDRDPVLLHGTARRLPGLSDNGALLFHLDVTVLRVGASAVLLDERACFAAALDPLAQQAPAVLSRLNDAHADALVGCL